MDRCWTISGHGLTVDKVWISTCLLPNQVKVIFFVDKLWTRTYCGQSLDFSLFAPKSSESEIFLWTEIGQPLYLERPWKSIDISLAASGTLNLDWIIFGFGQTLDKVMISTYLLTSQSNPCINYLLV